MTQKTNTENSFILWQEWNEKEEIPGEPAILIEQFSDCICLTQAGKSINLNYHHVNELVKLLKTLKP